MDDCVGNRCQNNATCVDGIGSYVCSCDRGYSGDFCQNKIHFCSSPEFQPCQNGGVCRDHFTHYTCDCAPGFKGENCTINIDDCVDNMCQVWSHHIALLSHCIFFSKLLVSNNSC